MGMRSGGDRRRLLYGLAFGAILTVVTLAGIELLASFFAPPWPARAMVPRLPWEPRSLAEPFRRQPWLADADNPWGMRDRERSFDKHPGLFRAVFVGDSFVESRFTPQSLPAALQRQLDPAEKQLEAINLGVSATGPREYFFRLRDVALRMHPDALLVFLYSGNDFLPGGEDYPGGLRLVDPSPGGSLLASVMPRTNWLLANRLRLPNLFGAGKEAPPDEADQLFAIVSGPREQRLERLTAYVRTWIDPAITDKQVSEILGRAEGAYLDVAQPTAGEQEYLLDWMLRILMNWEGGAISPPRNAAEIRELAGRGYLAATLSWIEAMRREAAARNVPIVFFAIPVGSVDPDYRRFWAAWPLADTWNRICEELHGQLVAAATRERLPLIDLGPVLDGIPGTYRKLDGHWTQRGEAIVVERVAQELTRLMDAK